MASKLFGSLTTRIYVVLAALFILLFFLLPRSGRFNYDYRKGSAWTHETLVAQFDFPVLKTQEQLRTERDEAGSSVIPYYRVNEDVQQNAIQQAASLKLSDDQRSRIITTLGNIYSRGVILDGEASRNNSVVIVQRGKRASRIPQSDLYTVQSARSFFRSDFSKVYKGGNPDSVLTVTGAMDLVVSNLYFDKETTDLVHEQSANYISPTSGFISAGQVLVSKGEIITGEVQQILDSYKKEYESTLGYSGPRFKLWIGNALFAFALVVLILLMIYYSCPKAFNEMNLLLYLVTMFVLSTLLTKIIVGWNSDFLYMSPYTLIVLFLVAFFKRKTVLAMYTICLLPLLIFTHGGYELFMMFLVGGVLSMHLYETYSRGWKQFVAAFLVFVCLAIVFVAFRFIDDVRGFVGLNKLMYLFIGSMLSVLGFPLVYLFEKVFGLISSNRLVELAETSNPLLLELASKAPGTFQHTLQVATLAEGAARELGADVNLTRVGAMYHDIGKIENPSCFTENQLTAAEKQYHSGLSYEQSAKDIIRHVSDGLVLADRYRLPAVVKAFISTHHGTTHTGYYYNKYLNEGGDPRKADSLFKYPGPAPSTKEQIIVMMCDSIEAASRSLKDNSKQAIGSMVDALFTTKGREGQFSNAPFSMHEFSVLSQYLKERIEKSNQRRIAYPKLNQTPEEAPENITPEFGTPEGDDEI